VFFYETELQKIEKNNNDVYIVETNFGVHVVKSLENPKRDKQIIHFTSLAKRNKKKGKRNK